MTPYGAITPHHTVAKHLISKKILGIHPTTTELIVSADSSMVRV